MAETSVASTAVPLTDKVYSLVGKNLKLTSEQDIEPYLEQIRAIDGLREIHLGGNTLGVGACQALGKVLEAQKELEVADFADIFTGRLITEIPDALRALCDSLVAHESLREMDLSDNAFGGRSAEPMVNFLTHNHHFSILKLNNNGLGVTGGQIVANALLAAAEELQKQGKTSQLKTVICGRNRLEDGSAPYWAKAYAAHKTLEEVRMFQNGIRMDGIVALSQGLAACTNLKVFDVQDNTATVQGSRGIAASLSSWPQLEVLNLSDCLLKPKGGYLVLDALHRGGNASLHTLQLQYCDLDRKALERLASALDSGSLKNVSKLEINGNWADEEDECIEKIKQALEKNGREDALDELDEMDPEGEDDEADDDDKEEEEGEQGEDKETAKTSEIAAAVVAAPVASAAVAGTAVVAAASGTKDAVEDKLQDLSLKDAPAVDATNNQESITAAQDTEAAVVSKEGSGPVDVDPAPTEIAVAETAKSEESQAVGAQREERASTTVAEQLESLNLKDTTVDETSHTGEPEANKQDAIAAAEETEAAVISKEGSGPVDVDPAPVEPAVAETAKPEEVAAKDSTPATVSPDTSDHPIATAVGTGGAAIAVGGAVLAGAAGYGSHEEISKVTQRSNNGAQATVAETQAAETAAEVSESVQAVPDEKTAAETAAEVSESVQAVPDEKTAAETADEVAESVRQVPDDKTAAETAAEVAESAQAVPDDKVAAETADEVAEVAKQVPESVQTPVAGNSIALGGAEGSSSHAAVAKADEQTPQATSAASAQPGHRHQKSVSVDLSGELYGGEGESPDATSAGASSSAQPTTPALDVPAAGPTAKSAEEERKNKRKSGFRAAFGAIRELLR